MIVQNINNPERIEIYDKDRNLIREIEVPEQISGYEYEILETISCIKDGKLECPSMPHKDSIQIMRVMDELRESWGVRYPDDIERV